MTTLGSFVPTRLLGEVTCAAVCVAALGSSAAAQVRVEYLAHAAFVVQSPSDHRIVIAPYNGRRWLGYTFPGDFEADAVLVTHPHYDHDAAYYFGAHVPVLRQPGRYGVGDITPRGSRPSTPTRTATTSASSTRCGSWRPAACGSRIWVTTAR